MTMYVGTGKNTKEISLNETEIKLWDVIVNGEKTIYRGTEQAVTDHVWSKFYYEDWQIAPRKCLARSSEIVDLA
jgi:hypothetical protein